MLVRDRVASWFIAEDTIDEDTASEIITAAFRGMQADIMVAEAEDMTVDTVLMGVRAGTKYIHPIPPIPKTDRGGSVFIRPTVTEVGWDNWRSRGNIWGGGAT